MINVERASLSDADALCRLEEQYISCPWTRQQLISVLKDERYVLLVVRDSDSIAVAYGGVCFALDEAEICNVVTDEKYRRLGYAEQILDRIIGECSKKGVKRIFLEVAENNAPAVALYEKKGFRKIAVRKNYYQSGISANIMEKKL